MMNTSPQKRSSSTSFVGPLLLGHKFFSLARSHFPAGGLGAVAANKPKPKTRSHHHHRRLGVAPIPFAPLIDTHVFDLPPLPYSAHPRPHESRECLPVPHNTPERGPTPTAVGVRAQGSNAASVGLGLAGVERGNGERFDGLGELSGGFRASGTRDALRERVHLMLTEGSRRRRTRASEAPAMAHDVFYASVEVETCESRVVRRGKIRIRRKSVVGTPTPVPRGWERGTISSELKRV